MGAVWQKRMLALAIAGCSLFTLCVPACAQDVPYDGYTYDHEKTEQPSPNGYLPRRVVGGKSDSAAFRGQLSNPGDLFFLEDELFILDSGNSRVVVTDPGLNFQREISLTAADGSPIVFQKATGIFVSRRNNIYVADTDGECVYRADSMGRVNHVFQKPTEQSYDQTAAFRVTKVVVDSSENLYALVDGLYSGAVMFSAKGDFLGFFGSNEVEMTMEMLLDQSWKRLLSQEQKDAMNRFVPVAYTSFDITDEDFFYTCSKDAVESKRRIRKLNPSGRDLWEGNQRFYGDLVAAEHEVKGIANSSQIMDVDITTDGYLNALDVAKGRIFQYDQSGRLMFSFGGRGTQYGTLSDPVALESHNDEVYVLEGKTGSITIFSPTEYGQTIQAALVLYNDGEYLAAKPLWEQVLSKNAYSEIAYSGLGKAYFAEDNIAEALRCLRLSQDKRQYAEVFSRFRVNFVRTNFYWLVLGLTITGVLLWLVLKKDILRLKRLFAPLHRHFRVMTHPFEGYLDIQEHKSYSMWFSSGVVLYWMLLSVVQYFGTAFLFNHNDPADFNLLFMLVGTVLAYLLWVVCNWSISTLTDGKGSMRAIYCGSAYILMPHLLCQTITLVLGQVLSLEEEAFLVWIAGFGVLWSALLLFSVLAQTHQYTLGKTLGNIVLTLFGIVLVIFLLFMAVVLFEHVANLFMLVYSELTLRL